MPRAALALALINGLIPALLQRVGPPGSCTRGQAIARIQLRGVQVGEAIPTGLGAAAVLRSRRLTPQGCRAGLVIVPTGGHPPPASRCSSIRKFDGVEVLVPNSALLEKNVINWTLSDPNHRFDFPVGVAYGSDVDLVMRTLQEVLDSQPEILHDPASEVSFEAFGDSALGFHVYYWLVVGTHSAREIDTQLRIRIDRLFRERGIEMSFPQRDIHLIPSKPIPIRLEREP